MVDPLSAKLPSGEPAGGAKRVQDLVARAVRIDSEQVALVVAGLEHSIKGRSAER